MKRLRRLPPAWRAWLVWVALTEAWIWLHLGPRGLPMVVWAAFLLGWVVGGRQGMREAREQQIAADGEDAAWPRGLTVEVGPGPRTRARQEAARWN